uniref:Uncharacterized protein n=1 Tax=Octactis speculum TaxID=3111310 RepID=A0A7S2FQY2_9STRA
MLVASHRALSNLCKLVPELQDMQGDENIGFELPKSDSVRKKARARTSLGGKRLTLSLTTVKKRKSSPPRPQSLIDCLVLDIETAGIAALRSCSGNIERAELFSYWQADVLDIDLREIETRDKKVRSLEREKELLQSTKADKRAQLSNFAKQIDVLFSPIFNWDFEKGPMPQNIDAAAVLSVFKECFSAAYVNDWRNLVSLPEYQGHRKEEREKEIDKRMQKVAFHFLSIARVANQKHATDASMLFTWVAEADNKGYCGRGSATRTQNRIATDRNYALRILDNHMESYLKDFQEKQRTLMRELVWFVDNQQSNMKTKEQRADRHREGDVKATTLGAYKPHSQYEEKDNKAPRFVVLAPAKRWNRLYGSAFSSISVGAHASFTNEEFPCWLVNTCEQVENHTLTQQPHFCCVVQKNQVPQSWFREQGIPAPDDTDLGSFSFEIAEFRTEHDILTLFEESPLHLSSIRRAFFNSQNTEEQQLRFYKKKNDLRIMSMVMNYHDALEGLLNNRGQAIPYSNWQKDLSMSNQPHLWDANGNPRVNERCPLPSQVVDVSTKEGLQQMKLRLDALVGRAGPFLGPLGDGKEDTTQMVVCDEAIGSMFRASRHANMIKMYKGVVGDIEMAKLSLQQSMSVVPVVTEMHSQWHAAKTTLTSFWKSFIEVARNLLGYVGLNPDQEGKNEDQKKHLRGVLLRSGYSELVRGFHESDFFDETRGYRLNIHTKCIDEERYHQDWTRYLSRLREEKDFQLHQGLALLEELRDQYMYEDSVRWDLLECLYLVRKRPPEEQTWLRAVVYALISSRRSVCGTKIFIQGIRGLLRRIARRP